MVILLPTVAPADDAPHDLMLRHKQSLAQIETIRMDFRSTFERPSQSPEFTLGSFVKSGATSRTRQGVAGESMHDALIDPVAARTVIRHWDRNKKLSYETRKNTQDQFQATGEMYIAFLIYNFPGITNRHLTLEELYTLPGNELRTQRVQLDGRACVRVDLGYKAGDAGNMVVQHWHDVENGYFIVRRIQTVNGDDCEVDTRISEFAETGGIRFPSKLVSTVRRKGQLDYTQTIEATNIVINGPVAQDALALPAFPSGTICRDYITMQKYPIDTAWAKSGPATDIVISKITLSPDSKTDDLGNRSTVTEPRSFSLWLILGSGVVLTLSVIFLLVRRRRARRSDQSSG